MKADNPVFIEYFTDILCVWAYIGQVRIDELLGKYGDKVKIEYRFCPVFSNTVQKITEGWGEKNGYFEFNRHLQQLSEKWLHIELNPKVWLHNQPASSVPVHIFIKAIQLLQERGEISSESLMQFDGRNIVEEAIWRLRRYFFKYAENVAHRNIQMRIAEELNLPQYEIQVLIDNGEAHAALYQDEQCKKKYHIQGSPTLVLNEGRQILYGNVGFRTMEANIKELMHQPAYYEASWC